MRDILVVVMVIAVALLCLGAVNHELSVDLDYFFGTWHGVSLLWLAAVVAALVVAVGLLAGGSAAVRAAGDRHKLEKELESTYSRLRAAEAMSGAIAAAPTGGREDAAADSGPPSGGATTDPAPAPTDEAPSEQEGSETA